MSSSIGVLFILSLASATNDYVLVTTGEICPESGRIQLPCNSCGPNWGSLTDCEDECNARADCAFVTYFEDNGCRIYATCDLSETADGADTEVYERHNASVVTRDDGPCDILAAAGTPCVAAQPCACAPLP